MLSWIMASVCVSPGAPHAAKNSSVFSSALTSHFNRHVPALRNAESFEDAHGRDFRRSIFSDDLAHHQLQSQAVFALLLLGHVAHQAAYGQGIAGFLPLAEAQLQFQHAAVAVWLRNGARSIISPSSARRNSAATSPRHAVPNSSSNEFSVHQRVVTDAEASLPRRVGIKKLPRRC